jgi:hypothetical protein
MHTFYSQIAGRAIAAIARLALIFIHISITWMNRQRDSELRATRLLPLLPRWEERAGERRAVWAGTPSP